MVPVPCWFGADLWALLVIPGDLSRAGSVLGGEGVELQAVERGLAAALFAVAELVGLARRFLMDRFPFAWVGRFGLSGLEAWG
ncbi:hypothetical protein GCM10010094_49880 [Streptomyces flaveus]|uniref:Uncharacterized protein n=1 Tax=Streptomyces flaveus TaxID=66370 RepID=A0A917R1I2_9ACTN|nr:hypothetical protein GCM10010094_49880 [Streptomyces flaveus]